MNSIKSINDVTIGDDVHVILIGHKKRQGKDTFAQLLKMHLESIGKKTCIKHFADPLKDIMSEALGVSRDTLDTLKNENDYYRGVLQRFGSGKMKEYFGQMCWKDIIDAQIRASFLVTGTQYVIVPDFRFPHEYIHGAITVNVVRQKEHHQDTHISETALDNFKYDHTINNNGSLLDLDMKAMNFAKHIITGQT